MSHMRVSKSVEKAFQFNGLFKVKATPKRRCRWCHSRIDQNGDRSVLGMWYRFQYRFAAQ